jgi:prepilin-type N-terminal cleavage/methylation domain-containing protein
MRKDTIIRDLHQGTPRAVSLGGDRVRECGRAFTLVELLVTIAIIGVLLALSMPVIHSVSTGSKNSQAATDVHRIVVAVSAFEVEYGRLPGLNTGTQADPGEDVAVGDRSAGITIPNRELFYTLRAMERGSNAGAAINFRRVVFFEGQNVKNPARPSSGFLSQGAVGSYEADSFFDPWGKQYCVALDYSGDGRTKVAYVDFSDQMAPNVRAAAFSLGADTMIGHRGNLAYRTGSTVSDDIISW